jgi:hypothetical protein
MPGTRHPGRQAWHGAPSRKWVPSTHTMRRLWQVHTSGTPRRIAANGTLAVSSGNRLWTWTTSGRNRSRSAVKRRAARGDHGVSAAWRAFPTGPAATTASLDTSWSPTSTPVWRSQATSSATDRFSPDGTRDE